MVEKPRIEISRELLDSMREVADEQGRVESEVLEEAVLLYLNYYLHLRARLPGGLSPDTGTGDTANIGRPVREVYVAGLRRPAESVEELFEGIDRGQRERGVEPLSEEEAMRLADEELHAMRREQRAER